MSSDPKPPGRIHDKALLAELHILYAGSPCWACGKRQGRNLHHLRNKPHDDVMDNLAWLCGSGSSGCHGALHGNPYVDADGKRWTAKEVREGLRRPS